MPEQCDDVVMQARGQDGQGRDSRPPYLRLDRQHSVSVRVNCHPRRLVGIDHQAAEVEGASRNDIAVTSPEHTKHRVAVDAAPSSAPD